MIRWPQSGELRVDEDDAVRRDEGRGIAAAALDHEQVVLQLLNRRRPAAARAPLRLAALRLLCRHPDGANDEQELQAELHVSSLLRCSRSSASDLRCTTPDFG